MTSIEGIPPATAVAVSPGEGAGSLPGIDVILPIGKPGAPAGQQAIEMSRFNGKTLIEWAVEEAIHAGATRILMVAPQDHAAAPAIARHLRQTVLARRGTGRGTDRGQVPRIALLVHAPDATEGWDSLIRQAVGKARGSQALLIDPVTVLTAEGRITTFASFMLRRAALERTPGQDGLPLVATADLPWEEALSLPVLADTSARPSLTFDRPAIASALTVFAGRALIPLPMPEASSWADPTALFPAEALVRALLAAGGQGVHLLFQPLDLRFSPLTDTAPDPGTRNLPFTTRLGLGSLQRII